MDYTKKWDEEIADTFGPEDAKRIYLDAGVRKYYRIAVYQDGKRIGYLTGEGDVARKEEGAYWFEALGDGYDEVRALELFRKKHPYKRVAPITGGKKIRHDWDY